MKTNKAILIFATIITCSTGFAHAKNKEDPFFGDKTEFYIKFGGWSKHSSDKEGYMEIPLNESHKGLGVEAYKNIGNSNNHWLGLGAWYMKDSFDENSLQLSVAYKYRWHFDSIIDSVDFNMNIGLVNRGYATRVFDVKYDSSQQEHVRTFKTYEVEKQTKITSTPMVTLNVTEHFHVDFTYLPAIIADEIDEYEIFFFRLGYKI